MEIKSPRRVLLLSPPESGVESFLKDLLPTPPSLPLSSTSLELPISTPYYKATLSIWTDCISSIEEWKSDFLTPEAREVIRAVGAWIYVFKHPASVGEFEDVKTVLGGLREVLRHGTDGLEEVTCLAIATGQSNTSSFGVDVDEWEDVGRELGFEFIDATAKGRNQYGEKVGLDRVIEALETTDWQPDESIDASLEDLEEPSDEEDFEAEEREMGLEFLGLKTAIANAERVDTGHNDGDAEEQEAQVEELVQMMGRFKGIKDTAAGMPDEERKRFAKRAVSDLMKEF